MADNVGYENLLGELQATSERLDAAQYRPSTLLETWTAENGRTP